MTALDILVTALAFAASIASTKTAPAATFDPGAPAEKPRPGLLLLEAAPRPGEIPNDWAIPRSAHTRTDTIDFGFYEIRGDGLPYAVLGGIWTWDHGADDPLEGWTSVDHTENPRACFRRVTEDIWTAEGNPLPWPDMNGTPLVICGSRKGESDSLGWASGIGYGNTWCQRLTSPTLTYSGTGTVGFTFHYFNETEFAYDYTRAIVKTAAVATTLNSPGFHGPIGIDTLGVISQQTYAREIENFEFGGGTSVRDFNLVLEFQSDGGLSDEDGANGWDSFYGPFGIDDVGIDGANLVPPVSLTFDFASDLQGWEPSKCPGAGSLMGVAPVSNYNILDPCTCELSGNVLEFHNDQYEHPGDINPVNQDEDASTCAVDRQSDLGDPAYLYYNEISAWWDQYAEMPEENGVLYRPGWSYWPWEPPNVPGYQTWSPRLGQLVWHYTGLDPICYKTYNVGTANELPPDSRRVKFIYEVLSTCASFGIDPCSNVTNFTPIIDNLVIRNVGVPNAPAIAFLTGCQFNDGFSQSQTGGLSTTDPGWANISYDTRFGDANAVSKQGDSLAILGANASSSTRWEAKLWLRVKREGPGQAGNQLYLEWKADFLAAKGIAFTPPQSLFTWGFLDSCESAGQAAKNRFCSQFRDGPSPGGQNLPPDPMFSWGADTGEQDEGNEIIPDLALTPGTKVEYFVTSNYTCTPAISFFLPDTAGGNYLEFEILPSFRLAGGFPKFPCVLFIDAYNRGSQYFVEQGLNMALNGVEPGGPIPDPTSWDRYDYLEAGSNYKAPMYREFGGNSGFTIPQALGYHGMIMHTGTFDTGATWARDWQGLEAWTEAPLLGCNEVQGLIVDGTAASKIVHALRPTMLTGQLGATHRCDTYFEEQCPPEETENDEQWCVRIDSISGSPFGAGVPSDVFGNWCPAKFPFSVLGATGSGAGNKAWVKVGSGHSVQYSQVINDRSSAPEKYRTCIEDFSYHLMTARDMSVEPDPNLECPADTASRIAAIHAELRSALGWVLGLPNPTEIGVCIIPYPCPVDVPQDEGSNALVNHLSPNRPNPFNPRTTIRFSLAQDGPARLVLYDAGGRVVRTLADGPQEAGFHEVVWDGTNDRGLPVASGVYWCRLSAAEYTSSRKMVVVK